MKFELIATHVSDFRTYLDFRPIAESAADELLLTDGLTVGLTPGGTTDCKALDELFTKQFITRTAGTAQEYADAMRFYDGTIILRFNIVS